MRTHVLVGLSALSLLSACSSEKPKAAAASAPEVTVMTVQPSNAPARFQFVGQTESSQQVEIRARVSGFLERRVYQEGLAVKAGQVLFEIDKKPFQAQLQAAKAELAQQQARLLVARQNLARVKPLAQENALSQKDLDDATGQEQGAAAAVEAAKANVVNAELNLGYCTITSPVSGMSSFAKLQDGTFVDPQNSLLTYVAKLDPMRVNFSLSENETLRFKEEIAKKKLTTPNENKWEVEVLLADGSVFPQRGHLTFSDAAFSEDTGTFLVRAEVANPNGALRPGQFVRINLLGASRPGSFVVPQRALQQGPRGEFVWIIGKDSKAEPRMVQTGEWLGQSWVISNGLRAGEKVIVDGTVKLAPGVPVKVTGEAKADPTAAAEIGKAAAAVAPAADKSQAPAKAEQAAASAGEMLGRVYFERNSAVISNDGAEALANVAARLLASPQQKVALSGFTDQRGDAKRNAELAEARARAVKSALLVAGVKATQIELRQPANIVGGEQREDARRVELVLASQG